MGTTLPKTLPSATFWQALCPRASGEPCRSSAARKHDRRIACSRIQAQVCKLCCQCLALLHVSILCIEDPPMTLMLFLGVCRVRSVEDLACVFHMRCFWYSRPKIRRRSFGR